MTQHGGEKKIGKKKSTNWRGHLVLDVQNQYKDIAHMVEKR